MIAMDPLHSVESESQLNSSISSEHSNHNLQVILIWMHKIAILLPTTTMIKQNNLSHFIIFVWMKPFGDQFLFPESFLRTKSITVLLIKQSSLSAILY